MTENENASGQPDQSKPLDPAGKHNAGTSSPRKNYFSEEQKEKARKLSQQYAKRPALRAVTYLDSHGGAVTAAATAVIAAFTIALAVDSHWQAKTAQDQLGAMNGQLTEMHKAYMPLVDSAKAAKDSARTAHDALVAVQRAFVSVDGLRQEANRSDPNLTDFSPIIRNSGPTPAVDVAIVTISPSNDWTVQPFENREVNSFVSWKIGSPNDPDSLFDSDVAKEYVLRHFTIGAQAEFRVSQLIDHLASTAGMDAQSNKLGRFFYGSIHYTDAFGTRHITKYCFRIDGMEMIKGHTTMYDSLCSHWNCTDDYCQKDKSAYQKEFAAAPKCHNEDEIRESPDLDFPPEQLKDPCNFKGPLTPKIRMPPGFPPGLKMPN